MFSNNYLVIPIIFAYGGFIIVWVQELLIMVNKTTD